MTIRDLAVVLFASPEKFLWSEALGNFDQARDLFIQCLDQQQFMPEDARQQRAELAQRIGDWPDFFAKLAGHDFFSNGVKTGDGSLRLDDFQDLWSRIAGFDVDGLMEIGDPRRRDLQRFWPKHDLGNLFIKADADQDENVRIFPDELRNNHVHFGQDLDFNILWLSLMMTEKGEAGGEWRGRSDGHFGEFESRQDSRREPSESFKYLSWCRFFVHCWTDKEGEKAFADFLANGEFRTKPEARLDWIAARFHCGKTPFCPDFMLPINEQGNSPPTIAEVENAMLARVSTPNNQSDVWRNFCALAYVITKNAAFHGMLSNTVHSFESFSRALARLDDIYRQAENARIFGQSIVTGAFTENYARSQSHAESPIILLRISDGYPGLAALSKSLRKYMRMPWEVVPTGYTLGFHRADFNNKSEGMRHLPEQIAAEIKGSDSLLQIRGVDLCGPEVVAGGEANYDMLISAVDTVFETRKVVENAVGREMRASFHVGEQTRDDITALLSILYTVLHPEFRPSTDRLSHALALSWVDTLEMTTAAVPKGQGDLLQQCMSFLRAKPAAGDRRLFGRSACSKIKTKLNKFLSTGETKHLRGAAKMVFHKVEKAKVTLEICPFSNDMVREGIAAANHPWKVLRGEGTGRDLLIGSDDPSLTQTLPWMERVFFALPPKNEEEVV